ncbi:amidase [Ferrovibrio sp.]|uniref:amidase n=1 Tax=Ferrovibrio sp. TaxID=1917215 RepID=UPI003D2ABED6
MTDATALLADLKNAQRDAASLAADCLDRIARGDTALKSCLAVDDAAPVEATRAGGPLHGLPLGVKDLLATKGLRTTQGSSLFKDMVPERDDPLIARARAAGAVILAKTNTPEFGFGAHCTNRLAGPTANPHDLTRSSGGSSGGSAAAVAAGLLPAAIGTDFGGSVRTPAGFCGVVGFRPTPGRLAAPERPLAWDALPTAGFLTRSTRDARLLLDVLSAPDMRDPLSLRAWPQPGNITAPRIAASEDLGVAPVAETERAALHAAASAIGGVATAHPDCSGAVDAFKILRAAHIHQSLSSLRDRFGDQLTETVRWNIARGDHLTAAEYLTAERQRGALHRRFLDFFDRYDFLLLPAASIEPFHHDAGEVLEIDGMPLPSVIDYLAITFIISLTGCPALSLPYWPEGRALPFGLQIVAAPGADHALLDFAAGLEQRPAFGFRRPAFYMGDF